MVTASKTKSFTKTVTAPDKRHATSDSKELKALFSRLKKILVRYAKCMTVKENSANEYTLVARFKQNKAKRFGGVAIRSSHVTFYSCPEILRTASPALKQHQLGTGSLTFQELDNVLIQEIEQLTATRFKNFQAGSW